MTGGTDGQGGAPDRFGRPTWAALVQWDVNGALVRYRVMAFIVGTALLALTAIVICQYGLGLKSAMRTPEKIVAPVHGYLYLIYLIAAADLARRARWRIGRIVLVVCSGFVPFLAFFIEHRITVQMKEEWATGTDRDGPHGGKVAADPTPTVPPSA